jgi:hypothetical protein
LSIPLTTASQPDSNIIADLLRPLADEPNFSVPQLDVSIEPNIDLSNALKAALDSPEFYPPLSESVFAGDTVAIVLQTDIPHANYLIESIVDYLISTGIELTDITLVVTGRTAENLGIPLSQYEMAEKDKTEGNRSPVISFDFGFQTLNIQVHDPENQTGHAYLAANEEGDPVYVNRTLVDADIVIPIGLPSPGEVNQQQDCIYPDFSTTSTLYRFSQRKGSFISRWTEIDLANEALGAFFTIQIVCGPGDTIRQVHSGAKKDALNSARAATNQLWSLPSPTPSDLCVATIEAQANDQSWDDFSQALIAASEVTKSESPIVIWSEISLAPDRNTRKACMSQFEDNISSKLTKILQRVAGIIKDRPVFLKSALPEQTVEELGLGHLKSVSEILRMAESHENCLVIRDAHKTQIKSGDDASIE